MLKDFHPSQITYILESRRTAKYGNIAAFSCGISLCILCVLPSHWSSKLSNIGVASILFVMSHKLEKLHKWSEDYIGLWTRLKQKMDECHSKYWTAEIEALVI